ncbi:alpha-galactosidase, partial [bacterium]|nr:alpha-galactosidase [bacterium]
MFLILISLSLIVGANSCSGPKTPQEWSGITVDVKADNTVESSQQLIVEKNGFARLDIKLTNKGTQIATIDSIEIRIPVSEPVARDMKIAYGSSSMGDRHVLVQNVGEPNRKSYSYMYAMIQMAGNQYFFAGSLSWRIFIPAFSFVNNSFIVRSNGEGKQLKPGESIHYEQIVLSRASDSQNLLDSFGSAIAQENGIDKLKDVDYKGWATWDYYAYKFTDKDIYENTEKIKQLAPEANLIQIDAGWYAQRGDFTISRSDLPGGMKEVADRIKAAGMTPGVWIDGFRANTDSEVFKNHPEYFLHDNDGHAIIQLRRPEGPDKDRVYIDYSHPGAIAHMAECIRVITKEMGIPYLKIDFMLLGLDSEILKANPTFKSIKPYNPAITDVERMRLGLKTMREVAGPDVYILGCSAVFGPVIGFVDGMRTGGDINPRYEA